MLELEFELGSHVTLVDIRLEDRLIWTRDASRRRTRAPPPQSRFFFA